jgi:hypothetical protein
MFMRRNTICGVAVEEFIEIFICQFWIITHSGNFVIVQRFIHLNVDLHQAANSEFELEEGETEHAV